MQPLKCIKILGFLALISIFLNACNGKLPGADARKFPADPKKELNKTLKRVEVLD